MKREKEIETKRKNFNNSLFEKSPVSHFSAKEKTHSRWRPTTWWCWLWQSETDDANIRCQIFINIKIYWPRGERKKKSIIHRGRDGASRQDVRAKKKIIILRKNRPPESTQIQKARRNFDIFSSCLWFFFFTSAVSARVSRAMKMKEADSRLYPITDAHDNNKNVPRPFSGRETTSIRSISSRPSTHRQVASNKTSATIKLLMGPLLTQFYLYIGL